METKPFKILIVDDDLRFQEPLERCLQRRLNANLSMVDNGSDAIEAVRKLHYDLVLLDLNIPGCSGFDVMREIRGFNKDIKIIVVSGRRGLSPEEKQSVDEQTSGFFKKPVNLASLVRQISRVFGSSILTEFPEAEINDYKGRREARDLAHALNNIFNLISMNAEGVVRDYEEGYLPKDKPEENFQEALKSMKDIVKAVRTSQTLVDKIREM